MVARYARLRDYSGYKAAFAHGLIDAGCLAHARRKFYDLWATEGSAIPNAIDYSRGRWLALTRYLGDGDLPCDNNWVENQIRPNCARTLELALRGKPARWEARCGDHELGALSPDQRARTACLPQGRSGAAADAADLEDRRLATASLGADLST